MKKILLLLFLPYLSPAQSLDWQVQDTEFSTGDTVTADFSAYGFNQITAYQFAMLYDTGALAFVGVTFPPGNPMGLNTGCFSWNGKPGYNVKPGELRHARSMPYGKTYSDGTPGFSYVFTAKQPGTLSQKVTLSTCCLYPPISPISYRWVLTLQPLTVVYVASSESTTATAPPLSETIRIYPNPTSDAITIECDTPVQVEIFNATGTLTHRCKVQKDDFLDLTQGANLVRITDGKTVIVKMVFKL